MTTAEEAELAALRVAVDALAEKRALDLAALHAAVEELERHSPLAVFRRALAEIDSQRPTQPAPRSEECQPRKGPSGYSAPTNTTENGGLSAERRIAARSRARAFLAGRKH